MNFRPLRASKKRRWSDWLASSHGINELPGHVIYEYDLDPTLYLTALSYLPGFELRQERKVDGLVATFEISPGVRTIANLGGEQVLDLCKIRRCGDLREAKSRVLDATWEGRLWWGTERMVGFPDLTSICYIFARNVRLPVPIKKVLQVDEAVLPFESTLDLV